MTATLARESARLWAAELGQRADVAFLDTETTGLRRDDEVVEIAVVDGLGQTLIDTLVRPRKRIPAEVIRIHGITNEMVAAAPSWAELLPELTALLERLQVIVVYNAPFDARMIDQSCLAHRLPPLRPSWHCAMRRYAEFAGVWNDRRGGYRWHSLGVAATALGLPVQAQHRALGDALTCRGVVQAMGASRD